LLKLLWFLLPPDKLKAHRIIAIINEVDMKRSVMLLLQLQSLLLLLQTCEISCYALDVVGGGLSRDDCCNILNDNHRGSLSSRRDWLFPSLPQQLPSSILLVATATTTIITMTANPQLSQAKTTTTPSTANKANPLDKLIEARDTLDTLLTNYKRATIDCTYADVPRELLESKNKELLLEKASTFALFDKSVSVETCKTTNRIVRDYLGVTGKGRVNL
jgi:hypothetical protein